MAPELTLGQLYDSSVDVFSFGILAFIIMTGNFHPYAVQDKHSRSGFSTPVSVQLTVAANPLYRPDVESSSIKEILWAKQLCQRCWDNDALKRPVFREILQILKSKGADIKTEDEKEKITSGDSPVQQSVLESKMSSKSEQRSEAAVVEVTSEKPSSKEQAEKIKLLTGLVDAKERKITELSEICGRISSHPFLSNVLEDERDTVTFDVMINLMETHYENEMKEYKRKKKEPKEIMQTLL